MTDNKLDIFLKGDKLYTDSREVAKMVGKDHKNLLRDVKNYCEILTRSKLSPLEFFKESSYKDAKGENRSCYNITKKGCEFVANKLTGEKGILFTAAYIDAFHAMEEKLKDHNQDMFALPKDYPSALRALADKYEENNRLKETNAQQQQVIEEQKPKVNYYDNILSSKNAITITQIAKDYGKTAQWMNEFLHKHKVQFKQGKTWLLYKDYATQGYTKSETYSYLDYQGEPCSSINTKWTQKGRLFIYDLLKHDNVLPLIDIDNVKERS